MTFKIGICGGHGGYRTINPKTYATPGKRTPDGEPEWVFNDKVVRAFIEEMSKYENVEIKRFDDPTGKTDIPLKTRTDRANAWGADIYISFHHNANTARWGNWTGIETFTYTGSNPKSEKLAKLIHPQMVKAYGLQDRGVKKANLHIVRETKMPSVLLEGGFMDSLIDIKKLRDDNVLKNAGIGVANAVAQYANLKMKETVVSAASESKNEGARKLNLKEWQLKELANMFSVANNRGILSSREWVDKTAKGEITIDEAVFLLGVLINRTYFNK